MSSSDGAHRAAFRKFMNDAFLRWEHQQGGRQTVTGFGEYLGVGQPTVSAWINGTRIPGDAETVRRLAVLVGIEIYDVLGLEKPDPNWFYVQQHWADLTPEEQRDIAKRVEEKSRSNEAQKSRKPRRASAVS